MLYKWILKFFNPLIVWWGKLHMPFTRKRVTGRHYYQLRDKINIGTVLLTTTRGEFSNLINPEKLKHSGIYVGDIYNDGVKYVVEALGNGVQATDLVTFMTTKDLVIGCRPKFIEESDKTLIQKEAKSIIGVPYDYMFEKSPKAFYCFEAVAHIFLMVRTEVALKCKEIIRGKRIFSYETFLNDASKFEVVFDSRKV